MRVDKRRTIKQEFSLKFLKNLCFISNQASLAREEKYLRFADKNVGKRSR